MPILKLRGVLKYYKNKIALGCKTNKKLFTSSERGEARGESFELRLLLSMCFSTNALRDWRLVFDENIFTLQNELSAQIATQLLITFRFCFRNTNDWFNYIKQVVIYKKNRYISTRTFKRKRNNNK